MCLCVCVFRAFHLHEQLLYLFFISMWYIEAPYFVCFSTAVAHV